MSFASPSEALAAISACLEPMSTRRHTGLLNSGATLDCCDDSTPYQPLIRIETATSRAKAGVISLHQLSRQRCQDLVVDVIITYQACFNSFDDNEADAVPIGEATAQGLALTASWWEAVRRLACCSPTNQSVRFANHQDLGPEGGCAGWEMRLEVDVSLCDCSDLA